MDTHARRRSPAVRARHRNRVPYDDGAENGIAFPSIDIPGIILDPGAANTVATADSTTATTTSIPAELPLHTSLITSSSTSTTPSSSSTPSLTPSTSSSATPVAVYTTPAAASVTPSHSPSASSDASTANSNAVAKSKGIPGVATGLIVAVILFIVTATSIFLVRKQFISNRQKKRATWTAGTFAKQRDISPTEGSHSNGYAANTNAVGTPSSFGAYGDATPGIPSPTYTLPPPPMSYNSVSPQSAIPPSLSPGMGGASAAVGMSRAAATIPADAVIQCTFIPTLPDELSIRMGEIVRVLAEYDDGWALCTNAHGERGMVPLECLDQSAQGLARQGSQADRRTSRRASSLVAARY